MTWLVYALVDPRDNAIRYVGKSSNPAKRLASHGSRSAARAVREWISSLSESPELRILGEGATETEALLLEQGWISRLRREGVDLLNARGGDSAERHPREEFSGLGERVTLLCKRSGLSQKALANLVGLDQGHLSRICNNERPNVGVETAYRLARALNTTVEYLVTGESAASKVG